MKSKSTRKALVIGNAEYLAAPLTNPKHDAEAMEEILQDRGFSVSKRTDLESLSFFAEIDSFCDDIASDEEVVLFYFAGHGIQCDGVNYLLPVDWSEEGSVTYESPRLDEICAKVSDAAPDVVKIFILDACRNNGSDDLLERLIRSVPKDVGQVALGQSEPKLKGDNILLAFSTAPGTSAQDSDGFGSRNGLYTGCLVSRMATHGASVEDLFRWVREDVLTKSRFRQIPWEHSSLRQGFSFDCYDVPRYLIDVIDVPFDTLYSSFFFGQGKQVMLGGDSGTVCLTDLDDQIKGFELPIDDDLHVEVVGGTPEVLMAGCSDGALYNLCRAKDDSVLNLFDSGFYAFAVAPDGRDAVACGSGGTVKVVDIDRFTVTNVIETGIETVYFALHLPGDGRRVLLCGSKRRLEVWDLDTSSLWKSMECASYHSNTAALSSDGTLVATGHNGGIVRIWDAEKLSEIRAVELGDTIRNIVSLVEISKDTGNSPTNHIVSLAFSKDPNVLAVGTSDPALVFLDVKYGEVIASVDLDHSVSQVYSISLSPSGDTLVCSGHKRKAYIFGTGIAI